MKKRFISILLTVLMVMSLVPGMALNTYAENTASTAQTIEYRMEEGDYVLRICQKLGLNYYTCKQAIMTLNNINDGQWNKLTVGRTLILPASDYDATLIANGHTVSNGNTAAATGTAAQQTAASASTSTVSTAKTRDTIAYYLVPYTMSYGDTVSGVCANLGVNFNIFHEFIRQVNGVSNWNSVRAGQTLLIPTPVTPSVGTSCYAVMQHQVASNESAYGIASSNGINYNSAKNLLQVINLTDNLTSIQAGSNFYYPTATTILYPGTGASPSSSTTTTTTTTTDGNVTTTTTTVTSSKLYKLTSNMTSADGTMVFYVGEKAVNEARSGDVVTIVTQTAKNKAIQSLTVKNLDGTTEMRLNGDSFIMPSCDVRVDAVLTTGHGITLNANYTGKAAATVGGVSVSSAVKNAIVKVISSDPTYEVESVSASYKRFSWLASKTELSITDNSFVMPDNDVTVEVVLRPVTTYAFYATSRIRTQNGDVDSSAGGNFFLQVNGSSVTRAAKGVTVTVVPKANNGYQPCAMTVTDHNTGRAINIFNNTFTMPACDVDVAVVFVGKGNNIILRPANKGSVSSFVNNVRADEAATGDTVTLVAAPDSDSYRLARFEITRNSDGLLVNYNQARGNDGNLIDNTYTFTMPEGGVTVTPVFLSNETFTLTTEFYFNTPNGTQLETEYRNCSIVASYRDPATGNLVRQDLRITGDRLENVPDGVNIELRPDCSEGVAFIRYEVVTVGNAELSSELTNQANYYDYFEMPGRRSYDGRIVLRAYFETGKIAIRPAAISGNGTVSFQVNGNSANTANPGDTVEIYLTNGAGYRFNHANFRSKLLVTRRDNGAVAVPLTQRQGTRQIMREDGTLVTENYTYYTFTMPAEGVDVRAIFDPAQFTLRMRTRLESDDPGVFSTDVNGRGFWQIAVNGEAGIVDNDPTGTTVGVEMGDSVVVAMTEAGYSQYDLTSFTINGYEYIADVLNYFYNFPIEGDRAQNLDIVATLRPKYPYSTVFFSLGATYDAYKGNVEFMLLDQFNGSRSSTYSKDYQATFNAGANSVSGNVRFVKNAFAGDWVAIIAAPNTGASAYTVDVDDITITGSDADRIIPVRVNNVRINRGNGNPVTVDLFVFRMPETDVGINVDFKSAERGLRVSVFDGNNRVTASGLVRLSLDGTTYRDVADGDSFGNVPYGTMVYVSSTEYAMAQGKSIKSMRIVTTNGDDPVPYYDLNGVYQFSMPNNLGLTELRIYVGEGSVYDFENPIVAAAIYGNLRCVDMAGNIVTSADTGDEIWVYAIPDKGYANLKHNELKVMGANGMNIAEYVDRQGDIEAHWRFIMPQGGVSIMATFKAIDDYTLTFRVDGGIAQIATSISGWSNMTPIEDGYSILVTPGQTIYIAPYDGYSFNSKVVVAANAPEQLSKVNNVLVQYTVPELSSYGGAETLVIYLKESEPQSEDANIVFDVAHCSYELHTGDTKASPIAADPKVGDLVYIFLNVGTGYTLDKSSITVEAMTDSTFVTKSGANPIGFVVPEGGVLVRATTEPKTPTVTLKLSNLTSDSTAKPKVKVTLDGVALNKNLGDGEKFTFTYGQTVRLDPAGDFAWDIQNAPQAEKGKFEVKDNVVYYVSNGNDDTLTIKLKYTGTTSNVASNEAQAADNAAVEAPAEEVSENAAPAEQAAPEEPVEQTVSEEPAEQAAEEQDSSADNQTLNEDFFAAANKAAEEAAASAASD